MISIFDIFKISIGPSSSHTMGPMIAAKLFVDRFDREELLDSITAIKVHLYGSLSATGRGHLTDQAVMLGLAKNTPESVDLDAMPTFIAEVKTTGLLPIPTGTGVHTINFPEDAIEFHDQALALHENGIKFEAFVGDKMVLTKVYFSVGGGFVVERENFNKQTDVTRDVKYPIKYATDIINYCNELESSISDLQWENEKSDKTDAEIEEKIQHIWQTMQESINRGVKTEGLLPGQLHLPRRAHNLYERICDKETNNADFMNVLDWVNVYALAVGEENAAGKRIVTAPTNGAAGIIPAVLSYYNKFVESLDQEAITRFLMTAGLIGILYKTNASISGAEVGCQGEVGVACSMAAGGLAELLGAKPEVVCSAAEIAMEHSLGLTCDPVAELVQIPCIERNAIGAIKAISATRMAMDRTISGRIRLDDIITSMYNTGKDLCIKYRETSLGGMALINACDCEAGGCA